MNYLAEVEFQKQIVRLAELAAHWDGIHTPPEAAEFSRDLPLGCMIYMHFTDQELCDLLWNAARKLGHSPAKREVFPVYRAYLTARFGNWPNALRHAGLKRAAGRSGVSVTASDQSEREIAAQLEQVRARAAALGRMPHPSEIPEAAALLGTRWPTWGALLTAAGAERAVRQSVHLIYDLPPEIHTLLSEIRALAEQLNRAPMRQEVTSEQRKTLIAACGSWRNALYQIGLEPVVRITPFTQKLPPSGHTDFRHHRCTLQDCHYHLLHLDNATRDALCEVAHLSQQLGHTPARREVPEAIRSQLQKSCGSWSNALFQLTSPLISVSADSCNGNHPGFTLHQTR